MKDFLPHQSCLYCICRGTVPYHISTSANFTCLFDMEIKTLCQVFFCSNIAQSLFSMHIHRINRLNTFCFIPYQNYLPSSPVMLKSRHMVKNSIHLKICMVYIHATLIKLKYQPGHFRINTKRTLYGRIQDWLLKLFK